MAEPVRISHETIYTALYAMPRGHLRARVLSLLQRSHNIQQQLDEIAWSLNLRPRKSLRWKTPAELFLPSGAFDFVKN